MTISLAQFQRKFKPSTTIVIVAAHLVSGFAIWYAFAYGFSMSEWLMFAGLSVATGFGITVGYHRMMTHRGFSCGPLVRWIFAILGGLAAEGSEYEWVANHRVHHFFSDQAQDPHSPRKYRGLKGLLWAHIGWLFFHYERPVKYKVFRDLESDPITQLQSRYYLPIVLAGFFLPWLLLGWKGLLLAGFLRVVVVWNVTWSVNSICHWWGTRAKDSDGKLFTDDDSRNNILVAILGLGEGYHSNHHVRPAWAYHGWNWYSFDASKWLLRFLELTGLVWDVKKPVLPLRFQDRKSIGIAS